MKTDRKWLIIGGGALLLILGITVGFLLFQHFQGPHSQESEMQTYRDKISKHVILPASEVPALATITDPKKLTNNKFLQQGQSGDKILIYAEWGKAVLYRPSQDRVVDIGPVDVSLPKQNADGFTPLNK